MYTNVLLVIPIFNYRDYIQVRLRMYLLFTLSLFMYYLYSCPHESICDHKGDAL